MPRVKKTPHSEAKRMVVASNEPTDKVIDVSSAAFFIEPGRCYIGNVVLEGMSEQGTIQLIGSALSALAIVTPRQQPATLETDKPLSVEVKAKTQEHITAHAQLFQRRVIITGADLPLHDDDADDDVDTQQALPL